jgi:hypothetical protein
MRVIYKLKTIEALRAILTLKLIKRVRAKENMETALNLQAVRLMKKRLKIASHI